MKDINNLEDVYEAIGGFGRFQILAIFAILIPELPAGILGMLPVFVGAHPQVWTCTQDDDFQYLINSTSSTDDSICACNGTLDGGISSIVSEWTLVCDYAWVTDFITSIQMAGMMVGSTLGSQIPDLLGRRKSLYLFCIVMLSMGIVSGFTGSPFVYAATRFLIGLSIAPYIILDAVYVIEILPANWRTLCGALGPWAFGVMLLSPMAYFLKSWATLTWVAALPVAVSFISYPFLPESPRWLLKKGRIEEAKKALDTIAYWNGCEPVDMKVVERIAAGEVVQDSESVEVKQESKVGCFQLLQNPEQRFNIIIFTLVWFNLAGIYYGIGFNTKNLGGDPYINLVYMGLTEAIGFPTAIFANKWFGRRMALLGYFAFSTLALAGIILMELNIGIPYNSAWVTYLALITRFFVCGGWSAAKCFTAESFSTETRSTAIGICSTSAAIAGIIAPQLVFLGTISRSVPYFTFGGLAVSGMGLALLLTETKGKSIAE